MINTISDLLLRLKDVEKQKIDAKGITHTVTVGNMYEGLTKSLLDRALFKDFSLNVITNSFIINSKGMRSKELDILLIEGQGEKLPHTPDQYDVNVDQVIAVIQVKKKLNKQNLISAYNNLKNVIDINDANIYQSYHTKLFRDAYRGICNEDVFVDGKWRKHFDSATKEVIYGILKDEALLPPRILLGYEGYQSERSLREGFVEFLSENISDEEKQIHGFSPLYFPNLIINEGISIIKNNGMPFIGTIINQSWPFYCTNQINPLKNLLEIIWSRLSYKFSLGAEMFGEDLDIEGANLFLSGNVVNVNGIRGWNFHYEPLTKNQLDKGHEIVEWAPTKVSIEQHYIIAYLCKHEKLLITKINSKLEQIGKSADVDNFIIEILKTNLVYLDGYKYLKLLTDECKCFMSKDGYYAGDDKSGKLTRWVTKYYGDRILDLRT